MGIADELITRGWAQGAYVVEGGAVCLRGAAKYAACSEWGTRQLTTEESIRGIRAEHALIRVVDGSCIVDVSNINDWRETTFDDVLRIAKQADELLGW